MLYAVMTKNGVTETRPAIEPTPSALFTTPYKQPEEIEPVPTSQAVDQSVWQCPQIKLTTPPVGETWRCVDGRWVLVPTVIKPTAVTVQQVPPETPLFVQAPMPALPPAPVPVPFMPAPVPVPFMPAPVPVPFMPAPVPVPAPIPIMPAPAPVPKLPTPAPAPVSFMPAPALAPVPKLPTPAPVPVPVVTPTPTPSAPPPVFVPTAPTPRPISKTAPPLVPAPTPAPVMTPAVMSSVPRAAPITMPEAAVEPEAEAAKPNYWLYGGIAAGVLAVAGVTVWVTRR